mgnify:CR=1 FL=1
MKFRLCITEEVWKFDWMHQCLLKQDTAVLHEAIIFIRRLDKYTVLMQCGEGLSF